MLTNSVFFVFICSVSITFSVNIWNYLISRNFLTAPCDFDLSVFHCIYLWNEVYGVELEEKLNFLKWKLSVYRSLIPVLNQNTWSRNKLNYFIFYFYWWYLRQLKLIGWTYEYEIGWKRDVFFFFLIFQSVTVQVRCFGRALIARIFDELLLTSSY